MIVMSPDGKNLARRDNPMGVHSALVIRLIRHPEVTVGIVFGTPTNLLVFVLLYHPLPLSLLLHLLCPHADHETTPIGHPFLPPR